jgi:serine/threonine-protein kinase RsbT
VVLTADTTDCAIVTEGSLLKVRELLRLEARRVGLGLVDETKLITAGSELARNILVHAGEGQVSVAVVADNSRVGVRATFTDQGPGIADIGLAMTDGWTTTGSMGKGLPGSRRLVDGFDIESTPGSGTRVVVIKWKR